MFCNSNDEANSPHKSLLTEVSKLSKDFTDKSSDNIKLSKIQLSKMVQLGGFLSNMRIFSDYLNFMRLY